MALDMTPLYDGLRLRFSNPITVTLTRPASALSGPAVRVTVRYVQKQAERTDDGGNGPAGVLEATDATFNLWAIECGPLPPQKGCKITDDEGAVWSVVRVERCARGRRYRCHCRKDRVRP